MPGGLVQNSRASHHQQALPAEADPTLVRAANDIERGDPQLMVAALVGKSAADIQLIKAIAGAKAWDKTLHAVSKRDRFVTEGFHPQAVDADLKKYLNDFLYGNNQAVALLAGLSTTQRKQLGELSNLQEKEKRELAGWTGSFGEPKSRAVLVLSAKCDAEKVAGFLAYCLKTMRDTNPEITAEAINHRYAAQTFQLVLEAPWTKEEQAAIDAAYRKQMKMSISEDLQVEPEKLFRLRGGTTWDPITNFSRKLLDRDDWGHDRLRRVTRSARELESAARRPDETETVRFPRTK